jgi:hypothetical protein
MRAGQQRALDRIESTLLDDDLCPGSLFAIFTRLVREEAMPSTERVTAGPWRRWLRPALTAAFGLAAVVSVLVLSLLVPCRPACPGWCRGRGGAYAVIPRRTAGCVPAVGPGTRSGRRSGRPVNEAWAGLGRRILGGKRRMV